MAETPNYCKHSERIADGSGCRGCEHSINPFVFDGGCILSLKTGERIKARLERLKRIAEHEKKPAKT